MERKTWNVIGYDAFDKEFYTIPGQEYGSEQEAQRAARARFDVLNKTQPVEDSVGQDDFGIQDRVFIERPDGSKYRFIPIP